jgi:zinc-binding in reverse transcriptase
MRVMVFLWLMHHNRILTIHNLRGRGWCIPNFNLCRHNSESVQHLFYDCQFAKDTRSYILDALPAMVVTKRPQDIQTIFQSGAEQSTRRQIETATVFVLWRERCRRIFVEQEHDVIQITREICTELRLWFKTWPN